MTKTYQLSRLFTLVMPVRTAKGIRIVEFKGVQNMKMHGLYSTSDAELQQALEATNAFRTKVFRLISTEPSTPAESGVADAALEKVVQEPRNTRKSAPKNELFT